MGTFLFILFLVLGALFGWFCADVVIELKHRDSRKSWLGWVLMVVGLLYMWTATWQERYEWQHKTYDASEYNIVRDSVITNHNGQIDTTVNFKIVKK